MVGKARSSIPLAVALVALALSACPALGAPGSWEMLGRLADVRFAEARDVTADLGHATVRVELPTPVVLDGRPHRALTVGVGAVDLLVASAEVLEPGGTTASADPGPARLTIPVLAGEGVRLSPRGQALVLARADGVAVRWTELDLPDGTTAAAEVLVDVAGRVHVQYLRVPPSLGALLASSRVRVPGGVSPAPASAWRLAGEALLPREDATPKSADPLPPACGAPAATWCDVADGPGTSSILLRESFDDGGAAGRGWTRSNGGNEWHEVDHATCSPGSSADPGRAWYCGKDNGCTYSDNNGGDSLYSPTIGPLPAGARLSFTTRLAIEDPYDSAEVWIGSTRIASYASPPNANGWYSITALDLSAFAGQSVRLEWRLTSDRSVHYVGWFVDDVVVWDSASANADCTRSAGILGYDPCAQRVSTQWDFNENGFCRGCTYTFYALVECGREMHLPLDDMEGADVSVTNVVTGAPVSLRCVNQTALAQAGLGPYPAIGAITQDCCGAPGLEDWWGPPFDATDSAGLGHVTWGFPGCNSYAVYDTNADGALSCAELGTCGGELPNLSPGEFQTMDCSIADASGLCGLYRVDIGSGGNVWRLFANCDGTTNPQFQLFFDCTEAWAAYNPLPELAIANLATAGGCPDVQVSFDLVNLGCRSHPGPTTVRVSSNCAPPDTQDFVIPDAIPANGSVRVAGLPFTTGCTPVRIQVQADPGNTVVECTESPGAAACRAEAGVDSLATWACGCTASLAPDAGPDQALCPGQAFTLDGAASIVTPCAQPLYRWRDGSGAVIRDWSSDPALSGTLTTCPADATYTLDVSCAGEACSDSDTVLVRCLAPVADAGADVKACVGTPVQLWGIASAIPYCSQVQYRWSAPDGSVLQDWTASPVLGLGPLTCSLAGDYALDVRCASAPSCTARDVVNVSCVQLVAEAGPDRATCEGAPVAITGAGATATGCSALLFEWLDPYGSPLAPPSASPEPPPVSLSPCPGSVTLTLVTSCADAGFETCYAIDTMTIDCTKPAPPAPFSAPGCATNQAELGCGASGASSVSWDLDLAADADGNTIPDDDADATACEVTHAWPAAGTYQARVTVADANGCTSSADVAVDVAAGIDMPRPVALPACPGAPSALGCGIAPQAGVSYAWDLDVATDADGNTVPDDDADAAGCDASAAYPAGTRTARVTASNGACAVSADVVVDVTPDAAPGEVTGDRVARDGDELTLSWQALAGAATYRVSRGTLASLHAGRVYDHAAGFDFGACDTGGATTWGDANDAALPGGHYYLVTAVSPCGSEGTSGLGRTSAGAFARAARLPTATCP